jgi:hypothetical protein
MPVSESNRPAPDSVAEQMKLVCDTQAEHGNRVPRAEKNNIAVQHDRGKQESRPSVPRRHHGSALPD